jgi:hypothetical protein
MSHTRSSRSFDHARIAKTGFFAGLVLFGFGVVGELAGHYLLGSMPGTAEQGLFAMEVLGVLVGFFVPIIFGAVLPLTE